MMKKVFWVCAALLLAGFLVREASKVETPPFWYHSNQLGWELEHQKVPVGYDAVSEHIIRMTGIRYTPWRRDRLRLFVFNGDMRTQWVGDRLLVRYANGEPGAFSGGGKLHPPLRIDPADDTPLLHRLAPEDNGEVSPEYRRGPTIDEAIRGNRQ